MKKTINLKNIVLLAIAFTVFAATAAVGTTGVTYAAARPDKVVLSSVKSADYNAIKITWKKADNAKKYQVYRSASKNGVYKKIATTEKLSYKNTGLKTGQRYYYKVRAVSGQKYGKFSGKLSAVPKLKQVTVKGYTSTKKNLTLNFNAVNGADGYQIYRAATKNGEYKKIASTTELKYKDADIKAGKFYYYKVRAFRKVGDGYKFGQFSIVKKCRTQYTYEFYYLRDYENEKVYAQPWSRNFHDGQSGTEVLLYIKTNDPVEGVIDFVTENNSLSSYGAALCYDDIDKSLKGDSYYKVAGGYVYALRFSNVGKQEVTLIRIKDKYLNEGGYAFNNKHKTSVIKKLNLNTVAYGTGYNNWIKNTVAKCTTGDMNPVEKMYAVCDYILSEESGFTYNPTVAVSDGDWETVRLAVGDKTASQPFWVSKYWNSWVSPSVLEDIAEYIGGFDSIKNMYYVYEVGSPKWSDKHWYCRCKYDGKFYFFDACPMSDTYRLDSVEKPDFTDTSWMYKVD